MRFRGVSVRGQLVTAAQINLSPFVSRGALATTLEVAVSASLLARPPLTLETQVRGLWVGHERLHMFKLSTGRILSKATYFHTQIPEIFGQIAGEPFM